MEELKDIISGMGIKPSETLQDNWQERRYEYANATHGDLNEVDGYNCEICHNKGYILKGQEIENDFGRFTADIAVECKCMRIRSAIRRMKRSGLGDVIRDFTFDKYIAADDWQKGLLEKAQKFAKDKENKVFFIGGQSGMGKTHLCTAICREYLYAGKDVYYMLWRDEAVKLKACVNDPAIYQDAIRKLKTVDVLYIDDLFKTGKGADGESMRPTAADVNLCFEIINSRCVSKKLITIISSEMTIREICEIDEAIAGRIAQPSKEAGYCINVRKDPAKNYRMKGIIEI